MSLDYSPRERIGNHPFLMMHSSRLLDQSLFTPMFRLGKDFHLLELPGHRKHLNRACESVYILPKLIHLADQRIYQDKHERTMDPT